MAKKTKSGMANRALAGLKEYEALADLSDFKLAKMAWPTKERIFLTLLSELQDSSQSFASLRTLLNHRRKSRQQEKGED